MTDYNVREYGAAGDGVTLDTGPIQNAVDACHNNGGGRVVIPANGQFRSGMLALRSNVELHVERGAALLASGKQDDYSTVGSTPDQEARGYPTDALAAFITAIAAEHIAITGGGVIDGGGQYFVSTRLAHIYRMTSRRPHTIFMIGCRGVTMRDVILRDGAVWTIRLTGCEDVVVHGIRMFNDMLVPNNDGIDLDHCRNVRISDCYLECADDCIVMKTCKTFGDFGPCENITVTGCTLVSKSFALNIGCETHEPMRDMVFDSLVVKSSHRGVGIHLSHECDVENIIFSNMVIETQMYHEAWWGRAEPIYVVALPWTSADEVGHIRNVRFSNILCRGENGVFVYGWERDRIDDMVMENVRVEINKTTPWPAGRQDLRPWPGEDFPENPVAGFFLRNARNVTLRNCSVHWGPNCPDAYRYALESHHIDGLWLEHFRGEAAHPERYDALMMVDTQIEPRG